MPGWVFSLCQDVLHLLELDHKQFKKEYKKGRSRKIVKTSLLLSNVVVLEVCFLDLACTTFTKNLNLGKNFTPKGLKYR